MNRQLRLPLQRPTSYRREDLVVSAANADAVAAVDSWPNWHGGLLSLCGPPGSGKTHLACAWAEAAGAVVLTGDTSLVDLEPARGRPVLAENAQLFPDDLLFHLINMAGEPGAGLLLTATTPPSMWTVDLPDLRSRLSALHVAQIGAPDDEILRGVLEKFFRERNIRPNEELLTYLVLRIERSVPAAEAVVAYIDELADRTQRPVTRALAREVLERTDDMFPDSLAPPGAMGEDPGR